MTRLQDEPPQLPPGVWEAFAKEILNDGKEAARKTPVFAPLATMQPPQRDHQGVAVVQRDLPHFLRDEDNRAQRETKEERSGFGALAVILCLIGASAAGLGGYLISSNVSQGVGPFAWVDKLIHGVSGKAGGVAESTPARSDTPSRVQTAFNSNAEATTSAKPAPAPAPQASSTAPKPPAQLAAAQPSPSQLTTSTSATPTQIVTAAGAAVPPLAGSEAAASTPSASPPQLAERKNNEVASLDVPRDAPRLSSPVTTQAAPPAPPPPAVQPLRAPTPESQRLIERARKMIEATGDIAGARLLLSRALEIGDAQAAFLLAETYDNQSLARWGVVGLRGDPTTARRYYEQALAGGVTDARGRISALGN